MDCISSLLLKWNVYPEPSLFLACFSSSAQKQLLILWSVWPVSFVPSMNLEENFKIGRRDVCSPLSLAFVNFFFLNRSQLTLISFFRKTMWWNNALPDVRMGSSPFKHTLKPRFSSRIWVQFLNLNAPCIWSLDMFAGKCYLILGRYWHFNLVTLFVGKAIFFLVCNLKPSLSLTRNLFLPISDTSRPFIPVSLPWWANANITRIACYSPLRLGRSVGPGGRRGGSLQPGFLSWELRTVPSSVAGGRETPSCNMYWRSSNVAFLS